MSEYTDQDVAGLISGIAIPAEAKCGESLASWLARELNELEKLRTQQQGEAVGHIRGYQKDSTVANVYIDSCIDLPPVGTELYLHPPADEAIGVPTSELEKLEESRVALYDFLDTKLNEFEMQDLINITGQIWKVANTKKWQAPADNTVRVPVCGSDVRIVYRYNRPYGIRDKGGYLLFFTDRHKYSGQEERYRQELEQQFKLADYLLAALLKAAQEGE